jgi:hypothetical protein
VRPLKVSEPNAVAFLCIILTQEMRGADDEAAGPGHASGTYITQAFKEGRNLSSAT